MFLESKTHYLPETIRNIQRQQKNIQGQIKKYVVAIYKTIWKLCRMQKLCQKYSRLDKLTSYSTSVVQWFHRRLWAPLIIYWRKYAGSYGKNQYFDLNIHILRKVWRFTKKWRGTFLLGIKFPFMWVQMENMIFHSFSVIFWKFKYHKIDATSFHIKQFFRKISIFWRKCKRPFWGHLLGEASV